MFNITGDPFTEAMVYNQLIKRRNYKARKRTSSSLRRAMKFKKRRYAKRSKIITKRRRPSTYRKVRQLNKRVKKISKSLKSDQARHTHRRLDVQSIGSNAGQVNNSGITATDFDFLEACVANLRYYNPATPGTLTTANAATGTYTRDIHFESIYHKLTVRNNYQTPCYVTIYSCTPKEDTNNTAPSWYSQGVADQTLSIATTSPLLYMSDIQQVTKAWNLKVVGKKRLEPGREMHAYHSSKPFNFNPDVVDVHSQSYQAKYRAHQFVLRVGGCIGHDTVAAEYLTQPAQVDTILERKAVITYDAGVNLDDYSEDNNASASFTNSGVVSNKPVADNQAFSTA